MTRSNLERARRALYLSQRTIGDAQAAQSGRLPKRLVRRAVTRRTGRLLDRLWR